MLLEVGHLAAQDRWTNQPETRNHKLRQGRDLDGADVGRRTERCARAVPVSKCSKTPSLGKGDGTSGFPCGLNSCHLKREVGDATRGLPSQATRPGPTASNGHLCASAKDKG